MTKPLTILYGVTLSKISLNSLSRIGEICVPIATIASIGKPITLT